MFSSGGASMGEITDRRAKTDARIKDIQGRLGATEKVALGKACVYATGSFGRREAGAHSDLDLFIVSETTRDSESGDSESRFIDAAGYDLHQG
ncbi:hypothetical protein RPMA_21640 [Tardiphaga alba]|uniref:Polymerase nucleotidyl transferase domain-containing protein n=1 Tax=Tardiphaga alba TaxID=340268 RepID=A0ABX8AFJ5_9BRAD|nr:hypothetical protein RPMA_21640 [Tardiphaga alba]